MVEFLDREMSDFIPPCFLVLVLVLILTTPYDYRCKKRFLRFLFLPRFYVFKRFFLFSQRFLSF